MNLQRLKKELEHQTRNGRTTVYVRLEDLKELEENLSKCLYGRDRINISASYLEELIDRYEQKHNFKNSLKVDASELQNKINNKEGEKIYYKDNERDDR